MMSRRGIQTRPQGSVHRNYKERPSDRLEVLPSFLIVCEGVKTEPNYFDGFRLPPSLVRMHVEGFGFGPRQLVEKALCLRLEELERMQLEEFDQVWCVFDKDDVDDDKFNEVIDLAGSHGLRIAYSNEAFELWFLLHFCFYDAPMQRKQHIPELNKYLDKPYKKNDPDIYNKLYSRQEFAIKNAEHLLALYRPLNPAKANPSTTVHLLVKELRRFLPEFRHNLE